MHPNALACAAVCLFVPLPGLAAQDFDVLAGPGWRRKDMSCLREPLETGATGPTVEDSCGPAQDSKWAMVNWGDEAITARTGDHEEVRPAMVYDRIDGFAFGGSTQQAFYVESWQYTGEDPAMTGGVEGGIWQAEVAFHSYTRLTGTGGTAAAQGSSAYQGWAEYWSTSSAGSNQNVTVQAGGGRATSQEQEGTIHIGTSLLFGVDIFVSVFVNPAPARGTALGAVLEPIDYCTTSWQFKIAVGQFADLYANGETSTCDLNTFAYANTHGKVGTWGEVVLHEVPIDDCTN